MADYYDLTKNPAPLGRILPGPNGNKPLSIAYRSDGSVLAVGEADGSTELWNMDGLGVPGGAAAGGAAAGGERSPRFRP